MAENKEKTSENELEAIDLNRLIFKMLDKLPERSKNIIVKRFNLDNKNAKTLDEIGKEYEITRERVRQIEGEAMIKLKKDSELFENSESNVFDYLKEAVENHGGIMSEEKIIRVFLNNKNFEASKQVVLFILSLDDRIKTTKENRAYRRIYFYEQEAVLKFEKIIKKVEDYLQEKNRSMSFSKIMELAGEGVDKTESYLEANKIILKNILGEWGCAKWSDINPKNIKDKAYLALKKNKESLHFTGIANEINIIWPKKKKTNSQTVHNELIKDNRFVLIGRGIYALKEWGYEQGTVLDVVLKIMSAEKRALKQDEIIKEVLKKRQVKENTIILNLQNKKCFEKLDGKIYRLK